MYKIYVAALLEKKTNTCLIKHNGTISPKSFESRLCLCPQVQTYMVESI